MPVRHDDPVGAQKGSRSDPSYFGDSAALCRVMVLHVISVLTMPQAMPGVGIIMMKTADLGPVLMELRVWGRAG